MANRRRERWWVVYVFWGLGFDGRASRLKSWESRRWLRFAEGFGENAGEWLRLRAGSCVSD